MNRHFPFSNLSAKIQYIRQSDTEISTMLSFAGNKKVSKMVNKAIKSILDKEPRDLIIKELKKDWKEIQKKHPEILEVDVKENIFWYLDAVCVWVRYKEIGLEEILKK